MMRVAIAGSGGLAVSIAQSLATETNHDFIILSRAPKPLLTARGFQVAVVNYANHADLTFKLTGVDTVISTISGEPQIKLIDAAYSAGVRRFAPAEFEGPVSFRPQVDPLDRGKRAAIARLQQLHIPYTSFVCGIFYERFAPGGMAASALGTGSGMAAEGSFIMNLRSKRAEIPRVNAAGQLVTICMTSVQDVGRFVAAAIAIPQWPPELRMRGERMTVMDAVATAEFVRGSYFERVSHDPVTLRYALTNAQLAHNHSQVLRLQALTATSEGRYDAANPNLNTIFPHIQPVRLQNWLSFKWAGQ